MKTLLLYGAAALVAFSVAACGGDTSDDAAASGSGTSSDAQAVPAAEASTAAAPRIFKVKSGIVESSIDMMGKQKQTMYFDDYGAKQALVTTMDIMGHKSESITINADGWTYTYDPAKKEGTKMKSLAAGGANAVPNIDALSESMKQQYKLKEIDSRTIAGKEAKGFEMEAMGMPIKAWVWEGIPLRSEVKMGGDKAMVTEVEKLQVDVPVPADRFQVPADVKLTDMSVGAAK